MVKRTRGRVVLEPQIDVLLDSEPEAARVGKVLALKFVLLHLEAALQDFKSLGTSYLENIDRA